MYVLGLLEFFASSRPNQTTASLPPTSRASPVDETIFSTAGSRLPSRGSKGNISSPCLFLSTSLSYDVVFDRGRGSRIVVVSLLVVVFGFDPKILFLFFNQTNLEV